MAVLAVNNDTDRASTVMLPSRAERHTLTASGPVGASVALNGRELRLGDGDALPELSSEPMPAGALELARSSITFLRIADVGTGACR